MPALRKEEETRALLYIFLVTFLPRENWKHIADGVTGVARLFVAVEERTETSLLSIENSGA